MLSATPASAPKWLNSEVNEFKEINCGEGAASQIKHKYLLVPTAVKDNYLVYVI